MQHINYRTLDAEIKRVVACYIATYKEQDEYYKQAVVTSIMKVAFGVAYVVETQSVHKVEEKTLSLPSTWFDHLLLFLPLQLQFGWLKPKFTTFVENTTYVVRASVNFTNKPFPPEYKSNTYTYVEYL